MHGDKPNPNARPFKLRKQRNIRLTQPSDIHTIRCTPNLVFHTLLLLQPPRTNR